MRPLTRRMGNLLGRPIWFWLICTIVVIIGAGILMVLSTAMAKAQAPGETTPLDCLSCHTRLLKGHDVLGQGSQACWTCHDSVNIGKLRLADGSQLSLADSTQVCGQCHKGRYEAWQAGTHGMPAPIKARCVVCHNPHQPQIPVTSVAPPEPPTMAGADASLACLSCHVRVLHGHDKLGTGSEACWACHYNKQMGTLHLAGEETPLPLSDYPRLCAQCHQGRYREWLGGTHGMPAWKEGSVEVHGVQRVGCIGCHDPHQPQLAFTGITMPRPPPAQPPPSPPVDVLIILGISLFLIIAAVVAIVRQGKKR